MTLHPTDGARFLLERESTTDDATSATYRGSVYTRDEQYDYAVTLSMGQPATLAATGLSASAALEQKLTTIAQLVARDAKKKQAEGFTPWPARILRWRGPK